MSIKVYIEGQGPNLVMLHGWGFNSHVWDPLLPSLTKYFKVYRVDLPGFGESDLLDWGEFRQEVLRSLPSQFSILGWSLGGLYAMKLALTDPNRVSHLFSVASTPRFIKTDHWPGVDIQAFHVFYDRILSNPSVVIDEFIQLQTRGTKEKVYWEDIPNPVALYQGLKILYEWDLRETLPQLKMPSDFVFGRLDAIVREPMFYEMKSRFPQFQYHLFKKSGHMPFISEKEAFVSLLMETLL